MKKEIFYLFTGCILQGLSIDIPIPFFKGTFLVGGTISLIKAYDEYKKVK